MGKMRLCKKFEDYLKELANEFINMKPKGTVRDSYLWLQCKLSTITNLAEKIVIDSLIAAGKGHTPSKEFQEISAIRYGGGLTPAYDWIGAVRRARNEYSMRHKSVSICGLNYDTYIKARYIAKREGKNIQEWINEVITEKINRSSLNKTQP